MGKITSQIPSSKYEKGKMFLLDEKILKRFSSNEIHYVKFLSLKANWNDKVFLYEQKRTWLKGLQSYDSYHHYCLQYEN